jgi:hypothetical protein
MSLGAFHMPPASAVRLSQAPSLAAFLASPREEKHRIDAHTKAAAAACVLRFAHYGSHSRASHRHPLERLAVNALHEKATPL